MGRSADVKSITLRSDWNKNGAPLTLALFTFNKRAWRFEEWGSRDTNGGTQNFTTDGNGQPQGEFIGPLPPVGEGEGDLVDLSDSLGSSEGEEWPWWMPKRFRVMWSGFRGDDLLVGENPQSGHLGLRAKPKFIGAGWQPTHDDEVYIAVQTDLSFGGSPYDVGVMIGWRHWWAVGQKLRLAFGVGTWLQATSDEDAGGQEGDWTGDHHPYPFVELKMEYSIADLVNVDGLYLDIGVYADLLRDDSYLGAGLSWGF